VPKARNTLLPVSSFLSSYRWELGLFVFGLAVYLPLLSLSEVFQVSEAREAVVVRTMLESGNYTLPLRHDELVPSKPILFHWLSALLAKLIGVYNVFVMRLPSALAAIATVIVVFKMARRIADVRIAAMTIGVMTTCYGFFRLASDARVDMLFSCFVVSAICYWLVCAHREFCDGRTLCLIPGRDYRIVALLSGFAVLTKGPLGLVLPGLVLLACVWSLEGRRACLSVFRIDWLIAIAVALPWYVLATLSGKDSFLARQIVFENFSRFFGESGIARKPIWFYLEHIFTQAAPWSFFAVLIFLYLLFSRRLSSVVQGFKPLSRERRFAYACFLAWFVSVFILISLSSGKRRSYLLPTLPAFAGLLALVIVDVWDRFDVFRISITQNISRLGIRISVPLCWALLLATLGLIVFYIDNIVRMFAGYCLACEVTLASVQSVILSGLVPIVLLSLSLNFAFFYLWQLGVRRRNPQYLVAAFVCGLQFVFWVVVNVALSTKAATHSYKDFASELARHYQEEPVFVKRQKDESYESLFFYYPRLFLLHNPKRPLFPERNYVTRVNYLEAIYAPVDWADNVDVLLRGGRDVDEEGEELVLFRLR
jgi:4-amino-4-deoxy-L-arabinose transferase-like glycosyltransferase